MGLWGVRGDACLSRDDSADAFEVRLKAGFLRRTYQVIQTPPLPHPRHGGENLPGFPLLGKFEDMPKFCFSVTCDTASLHWGLV